MDPTKAGRNRKFTGGRTWTLWDGPRLEGVTTDPVLFYDDPALGGVPVTWHAGVEVHKRVLVVALYGRVVMCTGNCAWGTTPPFRVALVGL
jgi:hypothetical protein